ncbi:MAG: hypothetical protein NTW87_06200 [Planctomycetota bacterium]|nr:hypothetical protein [Planctomycetota bacterium]
MLAREGWKTRAYEGGGDTVDLASLTLLALGQCAAPDSDALIHEFLKSQPQPLSLAEFRSQRRGRLALF